MKAFYKLIIVCLVLLITGCGGGTTGTGDSRSLTLSGKVLNDTGAAISQAVITVLESGDSATSNEAGLFTLDTKLEGDSATLLVATAGKEGQLMVSGIDPEDSVINIEITVEEVSGGIIVSSVVVEPRETPLPTPAATPLPGAPTATPKPDTATGKSIVRGTLVFLDDVPVPRAEVILVGPGKGDVTAPSGKFSIEFSNFSGSTDLTIVYRSTHGKIRLSGFKGNTDVTVTLKLKLPFESTAVVSAGGPEREIDIIVEKQDRE